MESFSFNGIKKDYVYMLRGRRRPAWAPRTVNWLNVPGMPGAHLESVETSLRPYDVPIGIKADNIGDLQKIKEDLADWLLHDEMKELIFEDEPDRTYFAIVDGTLDLEELVRVGKGVITFICAPYKYGPEFEATFPSDVVNLNYNGSAPGDPIFELGVLQPVTFSMIQNQNDEYMMIGKPVDVEDVPYTRLETVLNDNCSSLIGWSSLTQGSSLETGIVGGQMKVHNGYAFTADTYGTNPNGWVGPAIKKSLFEQVQDFRVEIRISAFNTSGNVGSLELHLLDENDNTVAVLAMRDSTNSKANNRAIIQLGSVGNRHTLLDYEGDKPGTWNDFSGIIRLEREGTEFRAYVAEIDSETGEHNGRHTARPFFDSLGNYQAKIAQVLVYDAKAKNYTPYSKLMNNIYVGKINQQIGIPYIADVGDIITFNHQEKLLLINGEPRKDLKDFGARYFQLQKGENTLIVHPPDSFNVTCKYRERFK